MSPTKEREAALQRWQETEGAYSARETASEIYADGWQARAALAPTGWLPMVLAPKDGTEIVAWCVHADAKYSDDSRAAGWEGPVIAKWIEHHGGGWTWHGLAGIFTGWVPVPSRK